MAGTNLPPLRPGTLEQQETAKSTSSCDPRMPNVKLCIEPQPKTGREGGQKAVYGFLLQELQPLFLEMGKLNVAVHGVREELHLMCAELQQIREVVDQVCLTMNSMLCSLLYSG